MRVLGLLAAVVVGSSQIGWGEEPVAFRVQYQAGERFAFGEAVTGQGELVRLRPEGAQRLQLDVSGEARREWRVEEVEPEHAWLLAVCREAKMVLRLANATYQDRRPWRTWRLRVAPSGRVGWAGLVPGDEVGVVEGEPTGEFDKLPFDLDLSELLTMIEIGLLPPKAMVPGQSWSVAATAESPFTVRGRFIGQETTDDTALALLETAFEASLPNLPTPAREVVLSGTLSGTVSSRFALVPGRVKGAKGPLELRLEFRRRGSEVRLATVTLKLDLAVTATAVPDAAAAAAGGGR